MFLFSGTRNPKVTEPLPNASRFIISIRQRIGITFLGIQVESSGFAIPPRRRIKRRLFTSERAVFLLERYRVCKQILDRKGKKIGKVCLHSSKAAQMSLQFDEFFCEKKKFQNSDIDQIRAYHPKLVGTPCTYI